MDPFWVTAAAFWWAVPVIAGAAVVSVLGVLRRRGSTGRRLGYDAARLDLRTALRAETEARLVARSAKAEMRGLMAGRAAGATTAAAVADARRQAREAERTLKAATGLVRARRVQLDVARAELATRRDPQHLPLPRTLAAHDAVITRWMAYEMDPVRLSDFPTMADVRDPATAAFLRALDGAREARPDPQQRVTPAEFSAYRDAVARLQRAFDTAEQDAQARAAGRDPQREREQREERGAAWQDTAQQVIAASADALDRAADAATAVIAAWNERSRLRRGPRGTRDERDH